jgi:hypothetical protein
VIAPPDSWIEICSMSHRRYIAWRNKLSTAEFLRYYMDAITLARENGGVPPGTVGFDRINQVLFVHR